MDFIWTVFIGFLIGAVAKWIMPGKDSGGCIITTLLGISGAVIATFLGQFIGIYSMGETAGFIGGVIGALIILWIYSALRNPN